MQVAMACRLYLGARSALNFQSTLQTEVTLCYHWALAADVPRTMGHASVVTSIARKCSRTTHLHRFNVRRPRNAHPCVPRWGRCACGWLSGGHPYWSVSRSKAVNRPTRSLMRESGISRILTQHNPTLVSFQARCLRKLTSIPRNPYLNPVQRRPCQWLSPLPPRKMQGKRRQQ